MPVSSSTSNSQLVWKKMRSVSFSPHVWLIACVSSQPSNFAIGVTQSSPGRSIPLYLNVYPHSVLTWGPWTILHLPKLAHSCVGYFVWQKGPPVLLLVIWTVSLHRCLGPKIRRNPKIHLRACQSCMVSLGVLTRLLTSNFFSAVVPFTRIEYHLF